MNCLRTLTAALILILPTIAVGAAELRGRLLDEVTGTPIPNAEVHATASGIDLRTRTDLEGKFILTVPEPPPLNLRLVVTAVAYRTVDLNLGDISHAPFLSLTTRPLFSGQVDVVGLRAVVGETPVTVTDITAEEIERGYWAQDVPMFLSQVPGFNAYSDSGNGIGYTYFSLRGFDMRRNAVSLNGVPLNDAESHGVFFIDLADFLSTTGSVQVQRGVGTTLYGGSAIGGSIDLETRAPLTERRLRVETLYGAYDTSRLTIEYDTGLIDDHWAASFRYSKVQSDGYRDQSWVDMWNYYAAVERYGPRSTLRLLLFGGPERTHLAFEGVPRAYLDGEITGDRLVDRRHNPLTYPREIDSFFQPHYQLLHSLQITKDLVLQNTLFFFQGDGYFQQFKEDRWLPEYDLPPFPGPGGEPILTTDLVRRREIDEWDGGWIPSVEWRHGGDRGNLQAGAAIRLHSARHFGFVQWAQYYPPDLPPDHRYYDYKVDKSTYQPFVQESWRFGARWNLLAGLTWSYHRYRMYDDQRQGVEFSETFSYLLPRLGLNFRPSTRWSLYGNVSRGGREPAFRDIYDPQDFWSQRTDLKPEELTDFELGATFTWPTGSAALNLYYLDFDNAIVWAGGLDNNGVPTTANGAVTKNRGIELDLDWNPQPRWGARLALAYSRNTFTKFMQYDFEGGFADHSGNRIAGTPDWLGTLELRGGAGPLDAFLLIRHVGAFYLDNTQDLRKDPEGRAEPGYIPRVNDAYTMIDLGIDSNLGPWVSGLIGARRVGLSFRLNNLANALFTTFGYYDGEQPVWIPAATRNAYAGLVFDW
ncbi:MAG: TonB-dependent receptor [Thermoanaerobaculales bacterium]